MTLFLLVSASIVCQAVLWGAVLVGAKVNAPRPLSPIALPRRVPGHAHESELVAWDLYYPDEFYDWELFFHEPNPQPWGMEALTESTAAYRTVPYEVPVATEYVSEAA